jgi:hypothetical protein
MALIFLGLTECSLCGKTLTGEDAVIGLPPLIDTAHPLYRYFDTGMHQSCYDHWDKKDEIAAALEKEKNR